MYRNGTSYRDETHYELETLLVAEAKKRSTKEVGQWILDERQAMLDYVNRKRAVVGKSPMTLKDVERVEQLAVGHSDYAHKFSLYCAELIAG